MSQDNNTLVNEAQFSAETRRELLGIARKSISARLTGKAYRPASNNPDLHLQRGIFVTLHNHGQLRGCLGRFDAGEEPLFQLTAELAVDSAQHDIRFHPVELNELPEIDIQISVLSPLVRVQAIQEIEVGKHGLQIKGRSSYGYTRSGTLLPQVASEHHWDLITFLESTCVKAGLAQSDWKKPDTEIYKYGAEVFGELDFQNPPYKISND